MTEELHTIKSTIHFEPTPVVPVEPPPIPIRVLMKQELLDQGWEEHVAGGLECVFSLGVDGVRERIVFREHCLELQRKDDDRNPSRALEWRTVQGGEYDSFAVKDGKPIFKRTPAEEETNGPSGPTEKGD